MPKHIDTERPVVGPSGRQGESRTGRCQRREAEMLEHARRANVPGVRKNKAAALMKFAKIRTFLLDRTHDGILFDFACTLNGLIASSSPVAVSTTPVDLRIP